MSGNDGKGPGGRGPMTGRGMGFCMLRINKEKPDFIEGFAGIGGTSIGLTRNEGSLSAQRCGGSFRMEGIEMPRGDGTGPRGIGSMTGRAAGYCGGYAVPGYINPFGRGAFGGRGAGRGRGFNQGFGRGIESPWAQRTVPDYANTAYAPAPTTEQELEMLKGQAEGFRGALQNIQQRISELEADSES